MTLGQWLAVAPVRLYQRLVSPLLGRRCRYHPTCSEYAVGAVRSFGVARGSVLAAWRLLRCNPWSAGGVDHPRDQTLFARPLRIFSMTHLAIMPQPVVDFAYGLLVFFHEALGSWGLSIIALTVAVRLVILPLTFKQVRGMQEMQRHAPELKKIQERYKDDTQRKNEETMKYYKEHNFNPLSSCLPLLLQIPVFITLFDVLKDDGPFAHAIAEGGDPSFLFIPNLAEQASPWPVLVLLMALYVGTQLGASLVSMVSAEGTQRRIMLILPFVFVPVIITFPAGLVVYWITTNLWTVLQQLAVKKLMPPPPPPAATESTGKLPSAKDSAVPSGNGAQASTGAKARGAKAATAANGGSGKPPPPSPRKKKKRSGRRR